jgi:SAM-dependent methyltransferase
MDERQAAQHIANGYDALPYEAQDDPGLNPRAVLGFGGVFGCAGALGDVLDLGCGTGGQLESAARETTGRLVGVDLSVENCRRARERLAPLGERAVIHHADFVDMMPGALGSFDLIYAVGLVFAVPPPVRAHALALIGACLRPGGVAVICHYDGPLMAARVWLHRLVRAEVGADLSPAEAIAQGREALARLAQQSGTVQMQDAARLSASLPDATFFHEVFNPFCEPVPASELDRTLASSDVRYLGQLEAPAAHLADAGARAHATDVQDLQGGGYHYAVFGKGARAPAMAAPGIVWRTVLRPAGGPHFHVGVSGATVQIAHAPTRTLIERLARAPAPILEAAPEEERDVTLRILRDLWANRLVMPLR